MLRKTIDMFSAHRIHISIQSVGLLTSATAFAHPPGPCHDQDQHICCFPSTCFCSDASWTLVELVVDSLPLKNASGNAVYSPMGPQRSSLRQKQTLFLPTADHPGCSSPSPAFGVISGLFNVLLQTPAFCTTRKDHRNSIVPPIVLDHDTSPTVNNGCTIFLAQCSSEHHPRRREYPALVCPRR